jgi:hypothetical protein
MKIGMKTRIISEEKCGNIVYKVQYKFLFWWRTCNDIGVRRNHYDITFKSVKEAQDYICKHYTKPIIKIII